MISSTTTTTKYLDRLDATFEDSAHEDSLVPSFRDLTIGSKPGEPAQNPLRKQEHHPTDSPNQKSKLSEERRRIGPSAVDTHIFPETVEWFKEKEGFFIHGGNEELTLAVLNGVKGRDGIKMCIDEAGRWRIAWGQLRDGTSSRNARY